MKLPTPEVDYRKLRINNLNSPEYKHLMLLIYWPIYGIAFLYAERFYKVENYYEMYCKLDDLIPFEEIFLIPYLFWFIFLIGIHVYTMFYDIKSFKKLMYFIILTYSISTIIFFVFPTFQNLRPTEFSRDNILTRFISSFYQFDTNTNVCPSLHVVGSLAVMFTAWNCKKLQSLKCKISFAVVAFLISISTLFLKQHSILDVIAALAVSFIAYPICFKSHKTSESTHSEISENVLQ